jgi:hypothetical protein
MTPQEKSEQLVSRYLFATPIGFHIEDAKKCAIIAVDEILNNNCGSHTDELNAINEEIYCDEYYWQEVKTEIEKL